jgi:3-deoxy-D-manno-octulosonate cytidylyltransferase
MRQLSTHPHHFRPVINRVQTSLLMTETRTLVLIPARMAATRLPGKPLLDIAGLPMIVHVARRAEAAKIGRVAVATDASEIAAAVTSHGFEAVMTRFDHPSGSDRIYEALVKLDPRAETEIVVNLQGDFPTIRPDNIRSVLSPLADPAVDIATLAAEIHTEEESTNPNVVKMVGSPLSARRFRALYFTRATAPWGVRRWSASFRCPLRRWSSRRNSSSSGPSRPVCGSTSPSSTRCRAASIRRPISKPPA